MKASSLLLGLIGLGAAAYLMLSPATMSVGSDQIARINQDLSFDLSYCETGVIGQTESACKAEARAEHARRLNGVSGFTNAIPLFVGGVSLIFLLYGIFGKSSKKNIPQPAYGAYYPPQQPPPSYYQQQPPPQQAPYQQSSQQPAPTQGQSAPPKTAINSIETKLAELSKLKESGAITEDEYTSMRQNLLSKF